MVYKEVFMENKECGYIYVLTNPSFPEYVKIGYADNVEKRLDQLNRSECTPFAFRLYAYYKVDSRLKDMKIHAMIDRINPHLRATDDYKGKKRVREFYNMKAHDAYSILETVADINNLRHNLVLVEPTKSDIEEDDVATEIRTRKSPKQYPKMDWLIKQELVKEGDEVFVIGHPEDKAIIVKDDIVNYKGEEMSLNKFGCKVTGWKAIQSYAMMKIVGKEETLSDMRESRMREIGMIE